MDNDGNVVPLQKSTPSASSHSSNTPTSQTSLLLPEVQEAISNHLLASSHEWATADLIESISKNHPKLAAGLSNPKYIAALQAMQTHPKETMERLKKDHPDIFEFLQDFCGMIGDHFVKLGEKQENQQQEKRQEELNQNDRKAMAIVREMGPLEEKALRRHRTQKNNQRQFLNIDKHSNKVQTKSTTNRETEMDGHVAAILSNNELRSILLDPAMQCIMEECTQSGDGRKLHYYMSHDEYGPKLRKLIEVGLLRLA